MGSLRLKVYSSSAIIILLVLGAGCGGHKPAGVSLFPARVNLSPGTSASVQLGSVIGFVASAQNAGGGNVNTSFTFTSSNTSILNVAPGGAACAGQWSATYTVCTPGAIGWVTVTAAASGVTSAPTYVFVHPPIDNIVVTGILPNSVPIQEPCLSQGQTMTIQATAYSQGVDVTQDIGPFTWSANNPGVVKITPLVTDPTFNFPTYQATVTAVTPGITQIYGSASGTSSALFYQPQYTNTQGTSPLLDFFATCNIQNVALQVGPPGEPLSGQTSFATSKGTSQLATAVITDIAGNTSLTNTNNNVTLNKITLTWSATQPASVSPASGCTLTCNISTPAAGAGIVTASCSPPTCNIGFPFVPATLSTPALINACTSFFGSQFPSTFSCSQVIPYPVYGSAPLPPQASEGLGGGPAITGLVTGATSTASVLATSNGCADEPPLTCTTGLYDISSAKAQVPSVSILPTAANSLLFDPAGDKAYMGSQFGSLLVNPGNFGTNNNPYTLLGTLTGQILAVSNNGAFGAFSDTVHTPNQVFIANTANASSLGATALNINAAVGAGFSPDGLKTFILADDGTSLYIYSPLQALQGPFALTGLATNVLFSPNGAFAFIPESSANGSTPNLTSYSVCNNQVEPTVISLPADPLFAQVLPGTTFSGTDANGNLIPDGIHILLLDTTGFDVITATTNYPANGALCPQTLTFSSTTPQRLELNSGTLQPVNFFVSPDESRIYVPTSNSSSVLVYNVDSRAVTGIQLHNNAIPVEAGISADEGTIFIAANDGQLHEINATIGGNDLVQLPFPNLPDYLNPFCTFTPSGSEPCSLNLIAVRP